MIRDTMKDAEQRMDKVIEYFRHELAAIRAGRATPTLVERIRVDYYGTSTPLNQLATISAPEPRLLVIQPWDKSVIDEVERAILKSDLGITPNNDGNVIRLVIPQLTEERRTTLVRTVRQKAEEQRVAIRNIRRDANDSLKQLQNQGDITEDQLHRSLDDVQDLTDHYISEINEILAAKEEEIMEV
jgi:ribosome recycling factor